MDFANLADKLQILKNRLTELESVLVAYSGGVDSTLLLSVACDVLCDNAMAVTALAPVHPQRESDEAKKIARQLGVRHEMFDLDVLAQPEFVKNPRERCYICKKILFEKMHAIQRENGLKHIVHGANLDDLDDFRPGYKAAQEMGVIAPLVEAGLTKADIRAISRQRHLPTADKPSMACLATRIPYGQPISKEALLRIEKAENALYDFGFKTIRVREQQKIARIELDVSEFGHLIDSHIRSRVVDAFKSLGYVKITLDLEGYASGSMNTIGSDKV